MQGSEKIQGAQCIAQISDLDFFADAADSHFGAACQVRMFLRQAPRVLEQHASGTSCMTSKGMSVMASRGNQQSTRSTARPSTTMRSCINSPTSQSWDALCLQVFLFPGGRPFFTYFAELDWIAVVRHVQFSLAGEIRASNRADHWCRAFLSSHASS